MLTKIKSFTAKCNNCSWTGSKFKLLISQKGDLCPKCNSKNTVTYGEKQTEENKIFIHLN